MLQLLPPAFPLADHACDFIKEVKVLACDGHDWAQLNVEALGPDQLAAGKTRMHLQRAGSNQGSMILDAFQV